MDQDKPVFVPHEESRDNNNVEDKNTDNSSKSLVLPEDDEDQPVSSPSQKDEINTKDVEVSVRHKDAESSTDSTSPRIDPKKPIVDQDIDLAATMFPPKKTVGTSKAVATVIIVAIVFMAIGFGGGYLGFKYSPKIANLIKISADSTETSDTTTNDQKVSNSATPSDVSVWPIYSNTTYLYSLKYPDNWYSQNTDDATAKSVILTNFAPQSKTNTEEKVEVTATDAGGLDLKTWLDAQSTISQNMTAMTKLTVDGKDAYRQESTGANPAINTYIQQGNYIITMTYAADTGVFNDGKLIYDTIVAAFKLS